METPTAGSATSRAKPVHEKAQEESRQHLKHEEQEICTLR